MEDNNSSIFYERHLPHIQPQNSFFFITFRLHGSLPSDIIWKFKEERMMLEAAIENKTSASGKEAVQNIRKKIFAKYDKILDECEFGPDWLSRQEIAEIIVEAIHHRDQNQYDLYGYTIMPNHVHLVFYTDEKYEVSKKKYHVSAIMERLKWYTAVESNKILGRKGKFWQHESYDHVVRNDDELNRIIEYVIYNPVKAGLVDAWDQYPYSYNKFCVKK